MEAILSNAALKAARWARRAERRASRLNSTVIVTTITVEILFQTEEEVAKAQKEAKRLQRLEAWKASRSEVAEKAAEKAKAGVEARLGMWAWEQARANVSARVAEAFEAVKGLKGTEGLKALQAAQLLETRFEALAAEEEKSLLDGAWATINSALATKVADLGIKDDVEDALEAMARKDSPLERVMADLDKEIERLDREEPIDRPAPERKTLGVETTVLAALAAMTTTGGSMEESMSDIPKDVKMATKVSYLPSPVIQVTLDEKNGCTKLRYEPEYKGLGLLHRVAEAKGMEGDLYIPLWSPDGLTKPFSPEDLRALSEEGWLYTPKGLWNMNHDLWPFIQKALPEANDLKSYGASLVTTTKEGSFKTVKVIVKDLNRGGQGSHLIHPSLLMAGVGEQCRLFNMDGFFGKGMFVPCWEAVDENGDPAVWYDRPEVKGGRKDMEPGTLFAYMATLAGATDGYQGNNPPLMRWCFEILENIRPNSRTKEIITSLVRDGYNKLSRKGLKALVKKASEMNAEVKRYVRLAKALNLDPMAFPAVRNVVYDILGKQLWLLNSGAGQRSPRYYVILHKDVPRGYCFSNAHDVGIEVAMAGYPLVFSRGLQVLKTMAPLREFDNVDITGLFFVNPLDAELDSQRDDDGDMVLVDDRPEVVELWKHRDVYGGVVRLENHSARKRSFKFDPDINSEGFKAYQAYIAVDHSGPVGRCTKARSRLRAVRDRMANPASALLIQCAVDQGKKDLNIPAFFQATNPENWSRHHEEGVYFERFVVPGTKIGDQSIMDEDGRLNPKAVNVWVGGRLKAAGVLKKEERQQIIEWWNSEKRIHPEAPFYKVTNHPKIDSLVHFNYDLGQEIWVELRKMMLPKTEIEGSMIYNVLQQKVGAVGKMMDWKKYWSTIEFLRDRTFTRNAAKANAEYKKAIANDADAEAAYNYKASRIKAEREKQIGKLQEAVAEGKLTLELCLTIWANETSYDKGSIERAMRLTMFEGSPLMAHLHADVDCSFLTSARLVKAVEICMADPSPLKKLGVMLATGKHHEHVTGVAHYKCTSCVDTLHRTVVAAMRGDSAHGDWAGAKALVQYMNARIRENEGIVEPAPIF